MTGEQLRFSMIFRRLASVSWAGGLLLHNTTFLPIFGPWHDLRSMIISRYGLVSCFRSALLFGQAEKAAIPYHSAQSNEGVGSNARNQSAYC